MFFECSNIHDLAIICKLADNSDKSGFFKGDIGTMLYRQMGRICLAEGSNRHWGLSVDLPI